ncbi:MAG TPA: trigger factor [Bdellovibrionota bacterium]|nr:trigger factor [Bdellovibrionota bacterium]
MKLKYEIEVLNPYERKIKVEVPVDEVEALQKNVISEFGAKVKLPGFRPGKIPPDLIKTRFAKEIEHDTLHKVIETSYVQVLQEGKLQPVSDPSIEGADLKSNQPVSYVATLEVRPEIQLKRYKGLDVRKVEASVGEHEIEETLKHLQHQRLQFKPLPDGTIVATGQFVTIDFEGLLGGAPFEGNKGQDVMLEMGGKSFIEGFEDQLVGKKIGDICRFSLPFPPDYQHKPLAGKLVDFTVTLKKVEEKILPSIDDEFAKSLGPFSSLQSLKSDIQEKLQKSKDDESMRKMKDELVEQLLKENPFAVPPSMIKQQKEFLWNQISQRLLSKGLPEDQLPEYEKKWDSDIREQAISQVKASLLLEEIAKKESIEVSADEVTQRVKEVVSLYVKPDDRPRLLKSQALWSHVYNELQRERVLDFLLKEAKTSE